MNNDELIQALLRDKASDPVGCIGGKLEKPVESLTEPPKAIDNPMRECIETIYQTIGVYLQETEEGE